VKSKLRGKRTAAPVKALPLDRKRAYADGWALFDEITLAIRAADKESHRRKPEDVPVLPNGSRDWRMQDGYPVVLPYWAVDAVRELVQKTLISNKRGMINYREDMRHYHRYAVCEQLHDEGVPWFDGAVYRAASQALKGTSFGAGADGMKKSHELVRKALKRGEEKRFYRSTCFCRYEDMLNTPGPIVIKC
jgi:hypothetical protein